MKRLAVRKFTARFPFIDDMGTVPSFTVSDKPMESKEEEALWFLNRMREHDGLAPLTMDNLKYLIDRCDGLTFELID